MSRTFASLALLALVGGCSSQSSEPGTPITLRRLSSSPFSGYSEPKRLVVRDSATWADVWEQMWKRQSPGPDLPAIDFGSEMVLVAALGESPSSGYGIVIDSAHATVDQLNVSVRIVSPGTGCGVLTMVTQPVDVVSVSRLDLPVQFVEHRETQKC